LKRIHLLACLTLLFLTAALAPGFAQQLTVSPTSISLTGQSGGAEVNQRLTLISASPVGFLVTANPAVSWLRYTPTSGSTPAQTTVDVYCNPAGLAVGTYTTTLLIYGGPSVLNVPVSFTVGSLGASPSSLSFSYQTGGTFPVAQAVTISGPTAAAFSVTVSTVSGGNWLQVAPVSGITPQTLSIGVNSAVVVGLASGTYTGTVNITPTSTGSGSLVSVPVTLTVGAPAQVTASPTAVNFGYQIGGANNVVQQTLTLSSNTTTAISYGLITTVDPNPAGLNWLTVNPTSGVVNASASAAIAVSVNASTLPQGTYNGKITVFTPGATPATQDIPVRLVVSSLPLLNVPTGTLAFTYQVGTTLPAAQTVTPTSTSTTLQYTIAATTSSGGSWLVVPSSGTTPSGFSVSVNPAGLASGTYNGTITVTGINTGSVAQQIPVVLTVSNEPVIVSGASSLSFAYQIGQNLPPLQSVRVSSSTGSQLAYSVSASQSWIVLGNQTSGLTEGVFTVQVNAAGQGAGSYDGTITITAYNPTTGAAVANSPVTIPVKLYVSTSPLLLASPTAMSFTAQVAGTAPTPQTISLTSTSATDQLNFSVQYTTESGSNWLLVGPQSGSTPNSLTVYVNPVLLSAGVYTGTIRVTATTAGGAAVGNSPLVIPVTLTMTQGALAVSPSSLTFTQTAGGSAPAAQILTVTSTGPSANYTVAANNGTIALTWLAISTTSGTTPGSVSVSVDASRLTPGTYQGQVTVSSPGLANSPVTIPVTFTVNAGTIAASPASLTFTSVQGGSTTAAQAVSVTATVGNTLSYSIAVATTAGGNWLVANPVTGVTPGTVNITANPAGLTAGTYSGSVTITSSGATGSPITIPVTFTVSAPLSLTVSPTTLSFAYTSGLTVPAAQTVSVTSPGGVAALTATAQMANGSGWLTVSPSSANTPASFSVAVTPQNLAAGTYTGAVTISSPTSTSPVTIAVTLTVQTIPPPNATAIVNSASFVSGAVAPGEIITIGGTGMAGANDSYGLQLESGLVATKLGDTRVLFDGIAAPLVYVSANQVNAVVPYNVSGRVSTRIQVEYKGVTGSAIELRVVDSAPAIFTQNQSGTGPGAISNQNFSLNTASNPAARGSVVVVYATGEGQTSPVGVNGSVTPSNGSGLKRPLLNVTATVGGHAARVLYAGSAPGFISGAFQVNVEIPAEASSGAQAIVVTVGANNSQPGVTVAVQ
jgi:uncharacterized protein (TIGR03437 family)